MNLDLGNSELITNNLSGSDGESAANRTDSESCSITIHGEAAVIISTSGPGKDNTLSKSEGLGSILTRIHFHSDVTLAERLNSEPLAIIGETEQQATCHHRKEQRG